MPIPPSYLEMLRDRVSIAEVVGRRVSFDPRKSVPAKGDYWACCPFHGEKTPSFHVLDRDGRFYCFGCHEKGGAIDFVMKMDNLTFPEAVAALAAEAGMPPPEHDKRDVKKAAAEASAGAALEAAARCFRDWLRAPEGAAARGYLAGRGLNEATIEAFEIGYAPSSDDGALRRLTAEGFSSQVLVDADIIAPSRRGDGFYDRFRDRIMFPIRDARGKCVGFGGRALATDAKAKYLNSRETDLFKKGRTLYNFGPARAAIRDGRPLLVVEGYMDVIALAQAGHKAAVAPLGTAVTEEQLALLWRAADEPILAFDGDAAGRRAADRAVDLALPALTPGKSVSVAFMPAGRDPDDVVREGGVSALDAVLAEAQPLIDRVWSRERDARPLDTPERRAAFEKRLADASGRIADDMVRRHYQQAFKDRRYQLFRNRTAATGPARGPLRRGGPRGGPAAGRGFFGAAPGATSEARSNELAGPGLADADAPVFREGAILLLLLMDPRMAVDRCAALESTSFADTELDTMKNVLMSALAALGDDADGRFASEAVERQVVERCGAEAVERLWSRFGVRLGALLKGEQHRGTALDELIAMHTAQATLKRELEDYAEDLLEGSLEDVAPHRLLEAQKQMVRSCGAPEDKVSDEALLSEQLKSIVDSKPWIKRSRRAPR